MRCPTIDVIPEVDENSTRSLPTAKATSCDSFWSFRMIVHDLPSVCADRASALLNIFAYLLIFATKKKYRRNVLPLFLIIFFAMACQFPQLVFSWFVCDQSILAYFFLIFPNANNKAFHKKNFSFVSELFALFSPKNICNNRIYQTIKNFKLKQLLAKLNMQ